MPVKPNDVKVMVQIGLMAAKAAGELWDRLKNRKQTQKSEAKNDAKRFERQINEMEEDQIKMAAILRDATEEVKNLSTKLNSLAKYQKLLLAFLVLNSIVVVLLIIMKMV